MEGGIYVASVLEKSYFCTGFFMFQALERMFQGLECTFQTMERTFHDLKYKKPRILKSKTTSYHKKRNEVWQIIS